MSVCTANGKNKLQRVWLKKSQMFSPIKFRIFRCNKNLQNVLSRISDGLLGYINGGFGHFGHQRNYYSILDFVSGVCRYGLKLLLASLVVSRL